MPITRAGSNKGSYYGDASYRTAFLRKQAIVKGQCTKETCSTFLSTENQFKKPFIGEHHLEKGFTNGITELVLIKNKDGIF